MFAVVSPDWRIDDLKKLTMASFDGQKTSIVFYTN
jgi:hypothetical protein